MQLLRLPTASDLTEIKILNQKKMARWAIFFAEILKSAFWVESKLVPEWPAILSGENFYLISSGKYLFLNLILCFDGVILKMLL